VGGRNLKSFLPTRESPGKKGEKPGMGTVGFCWNLGGACCRGEEGRQESTGGREGSLGELKNKIVWDRGTAAEAKLIFGRVAQRGEN